MNFIKQNIYYFLFVILIFEWPITSFVCGDYAAQWELNLLLLCLIALAGDVVWDLAIYFLWRFFYKSKFLNKFNPLKKAKDYIIGQRTLEKFLSKYAFLYLFVVKFTPYLSGTWLFLAWVKKYNFWKFLLYSTIISCIVKAVYIWLGYLWWISLAKLKIIQEWWSNFIFFLILWIIIFYVARLLSIKFMIRLKKKLRKNNG